jgi:DNA-binding transcriptional LysR family regulator
MHPDALKLYCDIVRLKSFSQGASANQVTQSAASQAIQQLEAELGVQLIDRSKRPFMLTPPGQRLYDGAQRLIRLHDELRASLAPDRSAIQGTVRVAAIYSVGISLMSDHIHRFMAQYPQARVRIEYLHPDKVTEAVLTDDADLGILSYPPQNRSLISLPWRDEPMVFVCHPGHRLARRRTVLPQELSGENFVAFDHNLKIRKAVDGYLREHGARPTMVMEFDNIETIKQAVSVEAGVSILPHPTVMKEVGARILVAIPLGSAPFVRPLGIIYRRRRALAPTMLRFLEGLRPETRPSERHPPRVAGPRTSTSQE